MNKIYIKSLINAFVNESTEVNVTFYLISFSNQN